MTLTQAARYKESPQIGLTQAEWRKQVVGFARHRGWGIQYTWRTDDPGKSDPDLTLVRSMPGGDRRIVFVSVRPKLNADQRSCIHALTRVAEETDGHVEVHCWSPSDWRNVREVLL